MKAVSLEFTTAMNELGQSYQAAMRNATSAEERQAATLDYQRQLVDLQTRARKETQRIRERYQ